MTITETFIYLYGSLNWNFGMHAWSIFENAKEKKDMVYIVTVHLCVYVFMLTSYLYSTRVFTTNIIKIL